ncbi:hypothetical protein L2U69_08330 [Zavarzinia compransoris]|uniref:hypothetical protein n=1 Tax=Zavarzinia marina TaxID=2911065 RepID=UPI001F40B3A2|nr:hypothetical protein [Zavarzinia marina]MCF4165646.1 hypothetical protein [Zavarzinia marina]
MNHRIRMRPLAKGAALVGRAVLMGGAAVVAASGASAQQAAPAGAFDGSVAVASSSFQLDAFAGVDESGEFYGLAPTVTLPLGDNLGLQLDGIGGMVGTDTDFYGGAAQLFFRDPTAFSIGVALSGVVIDEQTQYGAAAIAEYYIDNMTIEALAGVQDGDIVSSSFMGRLGLSYYAAPSFRFGLGVSYTELGEVGADTEIEFMLSAASGFAFYALGSYDKDGALGMAGLRLYAGGEDSRAKDGEEAPLSLMDRHRNMGRPNYFFANPSANGVRFISQVGGAIAKGRAIGEIPATTQMPGGAGDEGPLAGSDSAIGDLLNDLLATDSDQAPLGNLLAGILPAGDTGTPLDGIPIVGDLAGSVAVLLSPETLRVGDLPTGDNSLAAIPLVGDLLNLLPAEGTYVLLGSLQPEAVSSLLLPGIVEGITDPATVTDLLGRLGSTLGLPGLPSLE